MPTSGVVLFKCLGAREWYQMAVLWRPSVDSPRRRVTHPPPFLHLSLSSPFLSRPEPHILLFRRELGTDPATGVVDQEQKAKAVREYQREFGLTSAAAGGR